MNKPKRIFLIFSALLCGVFTISPAEAYFDKIREFKLDNGLHTVVIENHKAPIIKQMLFYKTGSVDEAIGKGGLAHLLEHLMFRGTPKISGNEFNNLMERNGIISNAFTSQDVTAYHQLMDLSRLDIAMFAEADRMQNLKITDEAFAAEKQIVFQERKQRIDNDPSAKFYEILSKSLWQNHPYSRQITGQDTEIMSLSKSDAVDFYNTYYSPNNAVLVLSGDIDITTARKLANQYYGKIKTQELKTTKLPLLPEKYKASLEMSLPDVKLGRSVNMFAAPSFSIDPDKVYALEVLSEYLGGDKNSPLYQKLVILDKKALSVDVSYNPISRSYGVFEISAVPVDNSENLSLWINRAWEYAMRKLDDDKIEMTKQKILADLTYLEDNPATIASLVGHMAAVGVNLHELQNYEANIKKVSLEDVLNAADYLRNLAPQVFGVLYPEKEEAHE